MYKIFFSAQFEKDLKKILRKNPKLKNQFYKSVSLLSKDPSHKSLRSHKLLGSGNWSASVNMKVRIIYTFRGRVIVCIKIGTHDEVY